MNIVLCRSEVYQNEDTIDQALSIKTFQPTIIDPGGTPKPLDTHIAIKVSDTREGGRREHSSL